ncbi:MAG TPA: alpha/beta hydrolase [Xanthomonadales bacterium]|nr:alpha/beta hydrolase [Xanthomonadales bacterium]
MIVKSLKLVVRHLARTLAYGITGGLVVLVIMGVSVLNKKPDLKVWHTTILDEEYRSDSGIETLDQYLALEDRLFAQLEQQVYGRIEPGDAREINRYFSGSLTDPAQAATNWNRTFEWPQKQPKAGIVLLHGMSDSPYSLRSVAQGLHERGAWVVGLRIPGHGQAPSGLVNVKWQDMAGAVRIAVRHVHERVNGQPVYIVGYSNGGALAVHYALDSLDDQGLPVVSGLILLSPEIGLSKLAALAQTQERLGLLLGLQKLAWTDVLPEYDPWKYNSFATNAARQAYLITQEIQKQLSALTGSGKLAGMPPILAFQSAVDATVTAPALVSHLFQRLPAPGLSDERGWNELVLFDLNRYAAIEALLNEDPLTWMQPMLDNPGLTFLLTLITNRGDAEVELAAVVRVPGSGEQQVCDIGLQWPPATYSLSHVALPFPPDDPYYGGEASAKHPVMRLGQLAWRGERDVLQVSAAAMLRLRWNPFHAYLMERIDAFTGLGVGPAQSCATIELPAGQ